MKKNRIKWGIFILVALFLGAALFCAVRLHLCYPNPTVEQVATGQTVQRNDITYVVEEAGFISRERANELWQDEQQTFEDFRGYFVTVRVTNHGNEEQRISLGDFILTTDVYAQGVDLLRFMEINDADIKEKFVMQPGASFTCTLPYMIAKINFTDKQWERLEGMQFKLLLSLYPVKREILL